MVFFHATQMTMDYHVHDREHIRSLGRFLGCIMFPKLHVHVVMELYGSQESKNVYNKVK